MNPTVATRVRPAPSGWYFSTKLKIGFSYFNRYTVNSLLLLTGDLIGLALGFECAAMLRWLVVGQPLSPSWLPWLASFWTIGAFVFKLLPAWGMSPVESLRRQVGLTCAVYAGMTIVLFLSRSSFDYTRVSLLASFLLTVPIVPFVRMLVKRMLLQAHIWGIPVAIYGAGLAGRSIIQRLKEEPGQGYYPVCVFDDNKMLHGTQLEGIPVRSGTDSIAKDVPVAILAMTKIGGERISELMEGSLSSYLRVMIIPNLIHTPTLWVTSRDLSGTPGLELSNNLLDPSKRVLKRSFELGLTLCSMPFWGPLYLLICALIWLEDRQNPIFKQERIGQGSRLFKTWKFRTMVPNAEMVLQRKLREEPELRAEWEANCKLQKDPRITKVGRFLRKTSLDEIPQLINVLKGDMSLIGPRPLPEYHYVQLPDGVRRLRERVKPGMSGLWQVSGRSDVGNEGMVRWDPYYVRNWSLWLDIVILVRTFKVVLLGSGAR
ncbi:undecaprenyl-phosphate galactose phosphotransferase WbaP [Coraliomargarita parva]|uniref:undecaprenyl-phosphate galactose phosphotransferase WbaP n=1 Tax=Coraliomargarita parva TaxID=3014050 RepID=UPI0022B431BD|nr:undecaprenyl-phosphate galactose phosphotransferase WbaP [Coraliomargarita parva]